MASDNLVSDIPNYAFNNANPEAAIQVQLLAGILDDHSTEVLGNLGIKPNWRCLDVGPGAGTITTWLADRVHPEGHVTAVDLDPRHLPSHPGITVHIADIRTVDLPSDHFDLIHIRLVLIHLPDRDKVLERLVSLLRPGGVLVISDWYSDGFFEKPQYLRNHEAVEAFITFQNVLNSLMVAKGADVSWTIQIPSVLKEAGLERISATFYNRLWNGNTPGCLLWASNSRQLRSVLLDNGMTDQQITAVQEAMVDPETLIYCPMMLTGIGYRPTV